MSLTLMYVNTVDILCNKEYNYGLTIMDYFPTTNTIDTIKQIIDNSNMVLWNGPVGAFEFKPYDKATNAIAKTIKSIKEFDCELVYQSSKGYGDALIEGINNAKTDYLCIFNADGSFNPKELNEMYNKLKTNNCDKKQ